MRLKSPFRFKEMLLAVSVLVCMVEIGCVLIALAQDIGATEYANGNAAYNQKNYAQAMQWSLKAAAKGNDNAMDNVGTLYAYGISVPQDYKQATKWFRKASALGNQDVIEYLLAHAQAK